MSATCAIRAAFAIFFPSFRCANLWAFGHSKVSLGDEKEWRKKWVGEPMRAKSVSRQLSVSVCLAVIYSLAAFSLTHMRHSNIYSTWRPDSLLKNENDWMSAHGQLGFCCACVCVCVCILVCMFAHVVMYSICLCIPMSVCTLACAVP